MRSGSPADFESSSLALFVAVKAEFDSGNVNVWGGYGDLTVGSDTYTGGGSLLSVSMTEETPEIAAKGAGITISGLDSAIISIALSEKYQNRPLTITVGTLDSAGAVSASYVLLKGRIDQMRITEDGETASIQVLVENRLIDLHRPRIRRFTNEDQIAVYPEDTGFSFVTDLQDKPIHWGKTDVSTEATPAQIKEMTQPSKPRRGSL